MTEKLPASKLKANDVTAYVSSMGLPTDKVAQVVRESNYEAELWNNGGEAGAWAGRKIRDLKAQNAELKITLEKLACRHVTIDPLWWQVEARNAIDNCDS